MDRQRLPIALAALGICGLTLVSVVGHPALSGEVSSIGRDAREIQIAIAQQGNRVDAFSWVDRGSWPAFLSLFAALTYISGYAVLRTTKATKGRSSGSRSPALVLPVATFAYGLSTLLAGYGVGATAVHVAMTCSMSLGAIVLTRVETTEATGRAPGSVLSGFLLVACMKPIETLLIWKTGAPVWPQLWFSLMPVAFGSGGVHHLLLLTTLLSVFALTRLQSSLSGTFLSHWLTMSVAWTVLLAPSEPLHGVTIAFATTRMAHAGIHSAWQALLVVLVIAAPIVASFTL